MGTVRKFVVEVRVEGMSESMIICVVAESAGQAEAAAMFAYNQMDHVVEFAEASQVAKFPSFDQVINAIS